MNDESLRKAREEYFKRTTPEQREEHYRKYVFNKVEQRACPNCVGKKRQEVISSHLMQSPFFCPGCRLVWIYKVLNPENVIKNWRTIWYYSKRQVK